MNIVILDGGTTNPGDLSWAPLEALGRVTVYPDSTQAQAIERAKEAEAIIINRIVLDEAAFAALPRLRYVGMLATGYNAVDTAAARRRGVTVCNVPDYCADAVAQHAVALLLCLAQNVHRYSALVRAGHWDEAVAHSGGLLPGAFPAVELAGKTLGIVGFGSIGARVAGIGRAMGMQVLVHTRSPEKLPRDYPYRGLEALFAESDAVSLHCPLTPQTRHLVNGQLLSRMKPGAFLINTARGGLVDSEALARALNSGRLAGAGLDVLEQEPPREDDPLLTAKNCVITPHIAWGTREARARLIAAVAENLRAWAEDRPIHVVS